MRTKQRNNQDSKRKVQQNSAREVEVNNSKGKVAMEKMVDTEQVKTGSTKLSSRNMVQLEKLTQDITTYFEAAPLAKESLTERRAALEQKKAERAQRLAEQTEKAAALVDKLKLDPEEERRFQQRQEAEKQRAELEREEQIRRERRRVKERHTQAYLLLK